MLGRASDRVLRSPVRVLRVLACSLQSCASSSLLVLSRPELCRAGPVVSLQPLTLRRVQTRVCRVRRRSSCCRASQRCHREGGKPRTLVCVGSPFLTTWDLLYISYTAVDYQLSTAYIAVSHSKWKVITEVYLHIIASARRALSAWQSACSCYSSNACLRCALLLYE